MSPNFRKILHQTSSFGSRKRGYHKDAIYIIRKTLVTPFDPVQGVKAVYTSAETELTACDLHPFSAKRWGMGVSENWADFLIMTDEELIWDSSNDDLNDEIKYNGVYYRIRQARHHDRLAFDDLWDYALVRKLEQVGGL